MLIQAIEKEKPDLVVMDLKMGGSDGLQLMEQIRRTFKTIPVLLSTAYPAFTLDPKFRATGCFVEKSADLTDLKEKIKNILDKGRDEVHYC
jgi:CheY-like chemotaxis protein